MAGTSTPTPAEMHTLLTTHSVTLANDGSGADPNAGKNQTSRQADQFFGVSTLTMTQVQNSKSKTRKST
jgi:hypothetical protein